MPVGTYPTRNLATFGPLELRPPFTGGFGSELITLPLDRPALGRRRPLYVSLTLSQGAVFLVNSRLGLFSAAPSGSSGLRLHPSGAPLLPKLRGQFAEFLNEESPDRLGALTPAHLCRFAVRALAASRMRLFSASRAQPDRPWLPADCPPPRPEGLRGWTQHLHRYARPPPTRPACGLDRPRAVTEY